jgi:hypothetical protein
MLDDCMTTQIPLSLAGSKSTHTKRLLTGISFLTSRTLGIIHPSRSVHDNGERFSSAVLRIGMRSAQPKLRPFAAHFCDKSQWVESYCATGNASRFEYCRNLDQRRVYNLPHFPAAPKKEVSVHCDLKCAWRGKWHFPGLQKQQVVLW